MICGMGWSERTPFLLGAVAMWVFAAEMAYVAVTCVRDARTMRDPWLVAIGIAAVVISVACLGVGVVWASTTPADFFVPDGTVR